MEPSATPWKREGVLQTPGPTDLQRPRRDFDARVRRSARTDDPRPLTPRVQGGQQRGGRSVERYNPHGGEYHSGLNWAAAILRSASRVFGASPGCHRWRCGADESAAPPLLRGWRAKRWPSIVLSLQPAAGWGHCSLWRSISTTDPGRGGRGPPGWAHSAGGFLESPTVTRMTRSKAAAQQGLAARPCAQAPPQLQRDGQGVG